MEDWGQHIEAVASALFGKPTSRERNRVRYGKRGSLSINVADGFWDDFEAGEKGGVLALIKREKGFDKADAIAWMRDTLSLDVGQGRTTSGRSRREEPPPAEPPEDREPDNASKPKSKIVKVYDYVDRDGVLLFQVCRMEPKTFLQRRKPRPDDKPEDIKGDWVWKRDGIVQVPYRLPELIEAIGDERVLILCEGEQDVDNFLTLGVPATTNAGGAGKWPDELTPYFAGADVVIIPDNDPQAVQSRTNEPRWHPDARPVLPGQDHAKLVAAKLTGVARSVRILELSGLPIKGDGTDWIKAGGTSAKLYELIDKQAISPADYQIRLDAQFPPKPFVSKFGAVVWGRPSPIKAKYEYLIKGLIPRKETVLFYGVSQCGKSFLTHDLAMTLARGGDDTGRYCGRKVRRGGVIYCAAEGGVGFVDKRFPGYAKGKQTSLDTELPFICLTKKFDLFGDEQQLNDLISEGKYWRQYLTARGIDLEAITIDTLNKVTPAMDEISGRDVGLVMKRLDRIREELDCGLWLVHHKNGAGTAPRGHTSLYAAFETAIEVGFAGEMEFCKEVDGAGNTYTVPRDKRYMLIQKQREGEAGGRFFFYLRGIDIDRDEDGEWRSACVVDWITKDHSQAAVRVMEQKQRIEHVAGERLTSQGKALYLALKQALDDHGVPPPPELRLPKTILRVVDEQYWRQAWKSRSDASKPDAVRKALQRQNDILQNKGWIGRSNPWVWVTDKEAKYLASKFGSKPAPSSSDLNDNVVQPPSGELVPPPEDASPDWSADNLGEPA